MGILTNAVNDLIRGGINFGFSQLDDFVTRKIQEGQYEEAFQAADQWENDAIQRMSTGSQGGGILPTGPIDLVPSNQSMAAIQKSPLAAEMVRARQQQFLQNDPYFLQQAAQRKQQESMMELNKQLGFETFKQNQGGTQTARDIFAGGNIGQDVRNQANAERNMLLTTATETAKEPFREQALQRQIRGKQSPAYAQLRGGGGSDGGQIVSSVTNEDLGRMEKILMATRGFVAESSGGIGKPPKKTLNQEGMEVLNLASDILARQKKKNPLLAVSEAKKAYAGRLRTRERVVREAPGLGIQGNGGELSEPQKTQQPRQLDNQTRSEARALINKYGRTPTVLKWLQDKGIDPDKL